MWARWANDEKNMDKKQGFSEDEKWLSNLLDEMQGRMESEGNMVRRAVLARVVATLEEFIEKPV